VLEAIRGDGHASNAVVGTTACLAVPDIEAPLTERVSEFLLARRPLLEAMDVLHQGGRAGPGVDEVKPIWLLCQQALRHHTEDSFSAELDSAGAARTTLLDALVSATSWESWTHLRFNLGRSPSRAERAMDLVVRAAIVVGTHPTRGSPSEL
jgi:TetR/AcrR family transcriptional regulator of autoinduction and epiphytic fitness